MAIARVQQIESGTTAATANTVTLSSASTSGNLLVTCIVMDKNSGAITVPTGFTVVGTTEVATDVSGAMAYKVSTGDQTAIWNWTTSQVSLAWMGEYTDVDTLDTESSNSTATADASISTGTTAVPSAADSLCIAAMGADTGSNVLQARAWSNSYVENSFNTNFNPGLSVAERILTSAAAQETTYSHTDTGDQMWAKLGVFTLSGGGTSIPIFMHHYRNNIG